MINTINLRNDVRSALSQYFDKYLTIEDNVYDIGCGKKPFASLLDGKVKKYIGVDVEDGFYDPSHIDLFGFAHDVPIDDKSADAVISAQVLEHLEYPEEAIRETARILKEKGHLFLAFPFLYPLHAEPHDYSRITEFKITKMLETAGFEILELKRIGGFWYLIGLFFGLYIQSIDRGILMKTKISTALLWFIRWFFNVLHNLEGFILRVFNKNPQVFRNKWISNYVLVAQKIKVDK